MAPSDRQSAFPSFGNLRGGRNGEVRTWKPKTFSWSYSKLKNYESCPYRYYRISVKKDVQEPESEALVWGSQVHQNFARLIDSEKLPESPDDPMYEYAPHIEKVLELKRRGLVVRTEQKYAITKDFTPCEYFASSAWYRAVVDVEIIASTKALILDWKTGKIVEDSPQLALSAVCMFVHYPDLQKVGSSFVWLKEDAETREDFERSDIPAIWSRLKPRVDRLQESHETNTFDPNPGPLCRRWCPVLDCVHNGRKT